MFRVIVCVSCLVLIEPKENSMSVKQQVSVISIHRSQVTMDLRLEQIMMGLLFTVKQHLLWLCRLMQE